MPQADAQPGCRRPTCSTSECFPLPRVLPALMPLTTNSRDPGATHGCCYRPDHVSIMPPAHPLASFLPTIHFETRPHGFEFSRSFSVIVTVSIVTVTVSAFVPIIATLLDIKITLPAVNRLLIISRTNLLPLRSLRRTVGLLA